MRFVRWILGLIAAAITTYIVGTALNSQFVIAMHDISVSIGDRFNMTMFDISNMVPYLVIIAVALLLGFVIATILKRFLPNLARVAYPIAGAAAIAVTLGAMYIVFQTVPISGARSTMGFLSQVFAGAIGGWVFAKVAVERVTPARTGA
ncbi:MAG: hypothetical protein ABJF89_11600 [Parasphingorhabdus sp.]|uniref:hypothetical protein n=1 Tax=Parasphingorhabdus sp. TaxID=2709688 RepID=UPI003267C86B